MKFLSVRIMIALTVSRKWQIHQLDVDNMFLNGELKEPVYMMQPSDFVNKDHPTKACLLHKSLYDLQQSPRT